MRLHGSKQEDNLFSLQVFNMNKLVNIGHAMRPFFARTRRFRLINTLPFGQKSFCAWWLFKKT
jgi:hypothetical protein